MRIIDEVCAARGLQEQLAVQCPDDPRRVFGQAVETASSSDSVALADLARAFSTLTERLAAQEETLARVRRVLEQDRAQITLNVRAPKRARDLPIAGDISGAGRSPSFWTRRRGRTRAGSARGGASRPRSAC